MDAHIMLRLERVTWQDKRTRFDLTRITGRDRRARVSSSMADRVRHR